MTRPNQRSLVPTLIATTVIRLLSDLAGLHAGDLRDTMLATRPSAPGAAALGDALLLQSALQLLRARWEVTGRAYVSAVPAMNETLKRLQAPTTRAALLGWCRAAGFPDAELATARLVSLLERVARQINGMAREERGDERGRLLASLRARTQRLRRQLRRLSARSRQVLPASLSEGVTEIGFDLPVTLDLEVPFLDGLAALLGDFDIGLGVLQAHMVRQVPGRPPLSDALCFGVEGWLAIWLRHHPTKPGATRKKGGFVQVGTDALLLAMEANGEPGRSLATRRLLETGLVAELRRVRAASVGSPFAP